MEAGDGVVRRAGCSAGDGLTPTEREIARGIEGEFQRGGLRPPNAKDVLGGDRRRSSLFQYLIESGVLVQTEERSTSATVVFHRDALAQRRASPGDAPVRRAGH